MWDGAYALGRVLTPIVFIVAGVQKFMDVTGILNSAGTKAFWAMVGSGAPPSWLGYLIAAVEVVAGIMVLIGYKARCRQFPW